MCTAMLKLEVYMIELRKNCNGLVVEVWMYLFLQKTFGRLLLWLNTVSIWKQNSPYSVDVCVVLILVIMGSQNVHTKTKNELEQAGTT